MPATDYLQERLSNFIFNGGEFVPPPVIYAALFTTAPTKSSAGVEVDGDGYARIPVVFGDYFEGFTKNTTELEFPRALEDWGEIAAVGLFNSVTGGELLYFVEIPVDDRQTVYDGGVVKISIADLVIGWED